MLIMNVLLSVVNVTVTRTQTIVGRKQVCKYNYIIVCPKAIFAG